MKYYQGYTDEESKTIKFIENSLIEIVKNKYVFHEWDIPALLDGDILKRCGYFKTMPNQLTNVGTVYPNAIPGIVDQNEIRNEHIESKNFYLTPAACIHLYPMIEKNPVHNEIITTKARVYRYEGGRFESGRRLWDFGVREFVAVGDRDFVKGFLKYLQEKALEFATRCNKNCHIEASNDHFYPTKTNETMQKMQKINGLKKELVHTTTNLAIASFNYHDVHFSKLFHFDNNKQVVTGCVGFGLDRWVNVMSAEEE